jgi:hypothetical protein
MDAQCVIYHLTVPGVTPPATKLINLNLPNGSSAQTIFEAIDSALGYSKPWVAEDTNTIHLYTSGTGLPIVLQGSVKLSAASGNTIIANSDGLYSPAPAYSGLVRVDSTSPLRYLADAVVGGTDGCVNIDVDDISGLLTIQPSLDIACLVAKICSSEQSVIQEFVACLLTNGLTVENTDSVALSLTNSPLELAANVKISASGGNTISIHSDGLYSAGGASAADNGLSLSGTTVQLGGPLIQNTSIDFAAAAYSLSFINDATVFMGSGSTDGLSTLEVIAGPTKTFAATFENTLTLGTSNSSTMGIDLFVSGGTQTDASTSIKTAVYGQFIMEATGTITLNTGPEVAYAGVLGLVYKSNSGNVASGNIISGGTFTAFASDTGNVAQWASIVTAGIYESPVGAHYTGTVTDYYGIYQRDLSAGTYASNITNKYAIFQEGSTMLNSFSTAVVVTSDERVKTNFEDYSTGLEAINKINVVKYHFIGDEDGEKRVGVVAQQVEKHIPEAVHTEDNQYYGIDDFRKLDTDTLVFALINAVKELSAQNSVLKERLDAIKQY